MQRMAALTCLLAGALTTVVFAIRPGASDEIEFKFNHRPAEVTRIKVTNKNVGSFKMPGPLPEQRMSQTFEQVLRSTCREIKPDNSAVFEMVIEDMAMKMSIMGMSFQYDTRNPDAAQTDNPAIRMMGRIFEAMKDGALTVTLSPKGHAVKTEGVGEMMRKAAAAVGDDPIAAQMFQQIGSLFEDDAMSQQMQGWHAIFPPAPGTYRVGDTWENQWEVRIPVLNTVMRSSGQYKLLGIQEFRGRRCAKIQAMEKLEMVDSGEAERPPGLFANMQMELISTSSNGIAYVDFENGLLVQYRQVQDWTMSMSMELDQSRGLWEGESGATDEDSRGEMPPITYRLRSSVSIDLLEDEDGVQVDADAGAAVR